MTIRKAIATVLGCAIGGTALGSALGYAIGVLAPGAYIAMFHLPPNGQVDPADVGLGLGAAQGLILGAVIGILLVGIIAWYDVRTNPTSNQKTP